MIDTIISLLNWKTLGLIFVIWVAPFIFGFLLKNGKLPDLDE